MKDHRDIKRVKVKLWEALYQLVGSGTIKARLHDVMLNIISIKEDEMPEEIVDDFAFVKHRLTKDPKEFDDDEGTELGRKILEMYIKLNGGI
jgi:hypothetical protein